MSNYKLTFQSVSIPTNSGGASVTVEEDSNTDGTTDTTETITLSDGVTSYSTTSGAFAGSGQVALSFDIGPPSDVSVTASQLFPVTVELDLIERYTSVYGTGSIDSTRQISKSRHSDVYGSGSIDSTRQVSKSRSSSLYGNGAIDNQILGFIDTAVVTSHVSPIHSFAENERTSLELLDFTLTYDDDERAWYTQWLPEDKITGNENDVALISDVAPQGKEPAARITVQYSTDKRDVTDEATPVYVDSDELVREITGLPSTEDGYYRLKIDQYSGYNDITNINFGLVN